jgi:hypothetical protein
VARVVCLLLTLPSAVALAGPSDASLDRTSVPANRKSKVHLSVKSFGRYGITATSKQGVAIQIVDKIAGPGPVTGIAGVQDGRIDAFFDRGTYRVVATGDSKAKGDAKLTVHPYRELNAPAPPLLVEHKPIDATLADFEQRSYWIDVGERRWVAFEAAGRNLTELRLWKDGVWVLDNEPESDTAEPEVGRPLNVRRLWADLEPGLYLLVAYGGPEAKWAEDDGRHPFHLRFGFSPIPSTLRKRFVVGPMGYDRFLVSSASFFRIELAEAAPLSLGVYELEPSRPYAGASHRAAITKQSVPPVAEVSTGSAPYAGHVVTVTGQAGTPYVLQCFYARWSMEVPLGPYWISTVHAGHAEDSLDATGLVIGYEPPHQVTASQVVELSSDRSWGRRFNLLEEASVFLEVKEAGKYRITGGGGAEATYRVEPFLITRPPNYEQPKPRGSGSEWDLDRGFFVLTLIPSKKGILEVTMARSGSFFGSLERLFSSKEELRLPRPAVRFDRSTTPGRGYWLYLNHQPGVQVGTIIRPIPLDLREPLSLVQSPGEIVEIPTTISEEGILYAEDERGERMDISLDGGEWVKSLRPPNGSHTVRVRNTSKHIVAHSVGLRPRRLEADTPLPPLPDGRLADLPKFPVVSDRKASFFDLERLSSKTFIVNASSPALYRLESSGLLATVGNLRTRVVTSLVRAEENGIGRNFLIQQYLGTGDHQITVSTLGRTTGHLGLRLDRTRETSGGQLVEGVPARATLRAGETIVYTFAIPEGGRHRLRAIGQNRTLRARLEDSDGWPIEPPNVPASFDQPFERGTYRLVVLPESVDVRVVALLEEVRVRPALEGHGPHPLPLDTTIHHEWIESKRSAKSKPESRERDVWTFDLPAAVTARITLTSEMHGDVIRVEGGVREKVGYIPPLRGWEGSLAKGSYRLEVMNLRETSDVAYDVAVRLVELVVGQTWKLKAPGTYPVSIGEEALVEISSFGSLDVAARLFDAAGRTVLEGDDRPDDWNFNLAGRLSPGRYTLALAPVARRSAQTDVTARMREREVQPHLQIPVKQRVSVGRNISIYPIALPEGARFLVLSARSSETLGLVLEQDDDGWRPLATSVGRPAQIEIPIDPKTATRKHRVQLWSADERNLPIDLWVSAIDPIEVDEDDLEDGVPLSKAGDLPLAIFEVDLDRPGTFRAATGGAGLRWSGAAGRPLAGLERGLAHPSGRTLWLARDLDPKADRLTANRVVLEEGAIAVSVREEPIGIDLATGGGIALAMVDPAKRQVAVAAIRPSDRDLGARFDVDAAGRVASVHLDGRGTIATVWAPEPIADPFDATLRVQTFAKPTPASLGAGAKHGILGPKEAIELELAGGRKRVRIAAEASLVAAHADGDRIERVVLSSGDTERYEAIGKRLVLLNPKEGPLTYAVEVLELPAPAFTLAAPYESAEVAAGRLELAIPPGKANRHVMVRGAEDVLFVHADGSIGREFASGARSEPKASEVGGAGSAGPGPDELIAGPSGGSLRIRHGASRIIAWIDPTSEQGAGLFGEGARRDTTVRVPSAALLQGASQTLRFEVVAPSLLHVRVSTPVIAKWEREGSKARILFRENGGTFDLYLPKGAGRLALRGLGGALLSGLAEVTSSPVSAIGEGLGPEVMVAPGGSRAFAFEVPREADVGIGVRADAADLTAYLSTDLGDPIGSGVAQMQRLAPGTYVLQLSTTPAGAPSRARPAIVGLDPPPTTPPPEIREGYLRAAGYREAK